MLITLQRSDDPGAAGGGSRRKEGAIREISKSQHAPAGAVSALEITNDCEPAAEEMSAQVAAVEWELSAAGRNWGN